ADRPLVSSLLSQLSVGILSYSRRMGNTWGQLFRVTTWGESHGGATGAVVDGCPSRLPLSPADIQPDLDRRAPGQSALVSQRKESDTVQILSGVFEGQTLGTPISRPALVVAERMIAAVEAARKDGNSLGGVVTCAVRGCPAGWGEPVFDRLEADLAKAVMSLPASKGFEIGSGFAGTDLSGAEHNDEFYVESGRIRTRTNRSGGVQGGITNGETIYFRVAFKPTATIMREQRTVDIYREET